MRCEPVGGDDWPRRRVDARSAAGGFPGRRGASCDGRQTAAAAQRQEESASGTRPRGCRDLSESATFRLPPCGYAAARESLSSAGVRDAPPHSTTIAPSGPDPTALESALDEAFASPRYRPPTLPAAAMEVMQLTSRPDARFGDVVKVLDRDPVLAARILSIAQSAMYATRVPVLSLQQAAVRLGLGTLRDLVLEAALHTKVFRVPGYDELMARLYRHSTATAHVTRALCKRAGVKFEYGFLAGLLHDLGIAAALLVVAERREWRAVRLHVLAAALDAVHAEASGKLASRWGLPAAIQEVIARHGALEVGAEIGPANAALLLAEQLCWEAGAGMLPPPPDADRDASRTPAAPPQGLDAVAADDVERARDILGLGSQPMREARREAFGIVDALGEGASART